LALAFSFLDLLCFVEASFTGLDGLTCGMAPRSSGGNDEADSCGVTKELEDVVDAAANGVETGAFMTGERGAAEGAGCCHDGVVVAEGMGCGIEGFPPTGATQLTAPPPFVPEQLHVQGPRPLTALEIPDEHRPDFGASKAMAPCAAPHRPTTGGGGMRGAVQLTVIPPFSPIQAQFHGPLPLTSVGVPAEQNPARGRETKATPLDDPHTPLTSGPGGGGALVITIEAEQVLAIPPFIPEHVHVHGPSP
jgi:hypothetical protein